MIDITMTNIGHNGRFGNQLFQTMVLIGLSKKFNCTLKLPSNLQLKDIFPSIFNYCILNTNISDVYRAGYRYAPDVLPYRHLNNNDDSVILDIQGYFQYQEALNLYDRSMVQDNLKFAPFLEEVIYKIHQEVKNKIVCHIRRGDYLTHYSDKYAIIQNQAYIEALRNHNINGEILFVGEEYNLPTYDLPKNISFLADFFRCMMAPIFLRSNSTFGWWAATLAKCNYNESQIQYSPLVLDNTGICDDIEFVNGNWPLMAHPNNFENCRNTDLYLPLT